MLSSVMTRALANGNSQASDWTEFELQATPPSGDGVFGAGDGGSICSCFVKLIPICEGPAGSQFSVRLYGWEALMRPPIGKGDPTWMPILLAELLCTASDRYGPGPASGALTGDIRSSERLCDEIELIGGALGHVGLIYSFGAGSNVCALARIELNGCRFFEFDFKQTTPNIGMNAALAKA